MAVHIRLSRVGAKKAPLYRVVVADQRSPRGGRFIEKIGTYDPSGEEASALVVNRERLDYWRGCGAQPSHTLERLLKAAPVTAEAAGSSAPSPKGRAAQKSS
jgi:small subunit ribosomal protein S16